MSAELAPLPAPTVQLSNCRLQFAPLSVSVAAVSAQFLQRQLHVHSCQHRVPCCLLKLTYCPSIPPTAPITLFSAQTDQLSPSTVPMSAHAPKPKHVFQISSHLRENSGRSAGASLTRFFSCGSKCKVLPYSHAVSPSTYQPRTCRSSHDMSHRNQRLGAHRTCHPYRGQPLMLEGGAWPVASHSLCQPS